MMNFISFILNDKLMEIDFGKTGLSPTMTLLQFLRSFPEYRGVKEGCREGDCGACTVVIGFPYDAKIKYKAIDSCMVFLPMVHGKQVITTEFLENKNGRLHPVQKSMIEAYGSQCGYCTPGITMALFSIYKNKVNNEKEIIKDLAGNLCRCTGYQSILEAAKNVTQNIIPDHFDMSEKDVIEKLNKINCIDSIEIHTKNQVYIKVFSLKDVLNYKEQYGDAIVISGNTDVGLRVNKRNELLPLILDISDVSEMEFIKIGEKFITIGANTKIEEIKDKFKNIIPEFSELLSYFGSRQIRNIATIGGNIGSASPIGDMLPALYVLNAQLLIKNFKLSGGFQIEQFILGYREVCLDKEDIIYKIEIPVPDINTKLKFYKISKRKELDISTVSGSFSLKLKDKIIVDKIRIAYGGMAATPKRAVQTEKYLKNKEWTKVNIISAQNILEQEFQPISDVRAESEFRMLAAKNLLLKFFIETKGNEK